MSDNFSENNKQAQLKVHSVAELNRLAKFTLEDSIGQIWVKGEISNFLQAASGHIYFSLKDENASVRCAFFKGQARKIDLTLKNGMQVIVKAQVSLYAPRGDYQLIISFVEDAGVGALQKAFLQLKEKLNKEGLFDETHKKSLPIIPKRIGLITSVKGAAIRDSLIVLGKRFPLVPVLVYPTLVQGKTAAQEIANTIEWANQHKKCDVLLLVRGGGSLEDLWSFNEEVVARAIFASTIPICSGVGHEIDFTIADFVADKRAATPTQAATLAVPCKLEMLGLIEKTKQQLIQLMQINLHNFKQQLKYLRAKNRAPLERLQLYYQKFDGLNHRLYQLLPNKINHIKYQLKNHELILFKYHPNNLIKNYLIYLEKVIEALSKQMQQQLDTKKQQFLILTKTLETISPLATLNRGYAIVKDKTGKLIKADNQVTTGDSIDINLSKGSINCVVKNTSKK